MFLRCDIKSVAILDFATQCSRSSESAMCRKSAGSCSLMMTTVVASCAPAGRFERPVIVS